MTKRDYLEDILTHANRAGDFIAGMGLAVFRADEKTNFAGVRCLEVIGEASERIPDEIRMRYPDIPWKAMAGMRDKLSYDYFGGDLEVVWQTVISEFPPLKIALESAVADQGI